MKAGINPRHRHFFSISVAVHYRLAGVAKPHPFIYSSMLGRHDTYCELKWIFPAPSTGPSSRCHLDASVALGSWPDTDFKRSSERLRIYVRCWAVMLFGIKACRPTVYGTMNSPVVSLFICDHPHTKRAFTLLTKQRCFHPPAHPKQWQT